MTASDTEPTAPTVARAVDTLRGGVADGALRRVAARIDALEGIRRFLDVEYDAIAAALHADLGLSAVEAHVCEIGPVLAHLEHALDRIGAWTRTRRHGVPLALRPGTARIEVRPKGTVLVLAPSTSPIQQLLAPLTAALAAGNGAILAPSSEAPATTALLSRRLGGYLDPVAMQVLAVDPATAARLLDGGVDHAVVSGRAETVAGLRVRTAETGTGLTATAGSKSPAIVAPSANVATSARRIAHGKFAKAGQSCLAPDYVLVPRSRHREFVAEAVAAVGEMYGSTPHESGDFGRLVSPAQVDRLADMVNAGGYQAIAVGGGADRDARYVDPTVLAGVSHDAAVMSQEICGPILPVLAYESLDDAAEFVNRRARPLAVYPFGGRRDVDRLVDEVRAEAVVVGHVLQPAPVPDAGAGVGADRDEAGFMAMSRVVPVVRRRRLLESALIRPPYTDSTGRRARRLF